MPFRPDSRLLLENWFKKNGFENPDKYIEKLEDFYDLIYDWSGKINLVSANDRELLVENHIIDSLSPVAILRKPSKVIDIGSGGGFPAIPLGIVWPHLSITMIESREKKARFLIEAVETLSLSNISVCRCRIEDYLPGNLFDFATIRAVRLTPKIEKAVAKRLKPSGSIIYFEKRGKYRLIGSCK